MSGGKPEDIINTISCIKKKRGAIDENKGETWLRHDENAQSGTIDVMILKGIYSIEEIADAIPSKKGLKSKIRRVKSHIAHLENKPANKNSNMEPHKLSVLCCDEIITFNLNELERKL